MELVKWLSDNKFQNKLILTDNKAEMLKIIKKKVKQTQQFLNVKVVTLKDLASEMLTKEISRNGFMTPCNTDSKMINQFIVDRLLNETSYEYLVPTKCRSLTTSNEVLRIIEILRNYQTSAAYDDEYDQKAFSLKRFVEDYEKVLLEKNLDEPCALYKKALNLANDEYQDYLIGYYFFNELTDVEQAFFDHVKKSNFTSIEIVSVLENKQSFWRVYGCYNEIIRVVNEIKNRHLDLGDVQIVYPNADYENLISALLTEQQIPFVLTGGNRGLNQDLIQLIKDILSWALSGGSYSCLEPIFYHRSLKIEGVESPINEYRKADKLNIRYDMSSYVNDYYYAKDEKGVIASEFKQFLKELASIFIENYDNEIDYVDCAKLLEKIVMFVKEHYNGFFDEDKILSVCDALTFCEYTLPKERALEFLMNLLDGLTFVLEDDINDEIITHQQLLEILTGLLTKEGCPSFKDKLASIFEKTMLDEKVNRNDLLIYLAKVKLFENEKERNLLTTFLQNLFNKNEGDHEYNKAEYLVKTNNTAKVNVSLIGSNVKVLTRKYNYIVGMSDAHFTMKTTQSPLLNDEELTKYLVNASKVVAANNEKRHQEAFLKSLSFIEDAEIQFSYPCYDTINMSSLSCCSLFLRLKDQANVSEQEIRANYSINGYQNVIREDCIVTKENDYEGNQEQPQTRINISATALETLIKCPLMYYYQYDQKIKVLEERGFNPTVWMEAYEQGNFFHYVVERYTKAVLIGKTVNKEVDMLVFEDCFSEVLKEFELEIPFSGREKAHDKEVKKLRKGILIYLKELHDYLTLNPQMHVYSAEFELKSENNAIRFDYETGEEIILSINGKIDRIDYYQDENGLKHYSIYDYKSGIRKDDKYTKGKIVQYYIYPQALNNTKDINFEKGVVENFTYVYPFEKPVDRNLETEIDNEPNTLKNAVYDYFVKKDYIGDSKADKYKCGYCKYTKCCHLFMNRDKEEQE